MNQLKPFSTELYFEQHEFTAPHLLAASDCESRSVGELLDLAGSSLEAYAALELGYTESWGKPSLRAAIANRYQGLSLEDVLVLGSPIEGISLIAQGFPEETVVLTPAYDALKNLPKNCVSWELRCTEDSWQLDFSALERLVSRKTKLIVVNFPHNPTGFVPQAEEWSRLLRWSESKGIPVFSDEMYRGLDRQGNTALPSAVELGAKHLALGGLSKPQGLPGLRCGWVVSRDRDLLRRLHDLKLYTSICPPAPVEFLAEKALQVEVKLLQCSRQIVDRNLALADQFFAKWSEEFVWRRPLAGSVALVELKTKVSASRLCDALASKHGIVLLPSSFLGFPDRYVRFGFGRRAFPAALEALDEVLSSGFWSEL